MKKTKRKTTEQFIEEARNIHNDKYEYSKAEYVNNKTKVIITCPIHGEFQQIPNAHLKGVGCPSCYHDLKRERMLGTTEELISKAKEVHGDKYDYSKVEYKSSKEKVIINCPIHGEFEQKPNSHLNGNGCPECSYKSVSKSLSSNKEEFIKKAKTVHGDKYNYSKVDYKGSKEKVTITCPVHGDFEQIPNTHVRGTECPECYKESRIDTREEFVNKARNIHGDKYDYSKVEYTKSKNKVTIICPIHGEFEQHSNRHISGNGCPECGKELIGFWNPEYIRKFHSDRIDNPCTLYVIECYSNDERFIKVGITTKTVKERYQHENDFNVYQYSVLYELNSTLLGCSEKEKVILSYFKDCCYQPLYRFGGSSECLQYNVKDSILDYIQRHFEGETQC